MSNVVARKLESIREKGALKHVDIAQLLDSRPETVSRWNQGKAYPQHGKEKVLLELEYIIDQLSDFYEPTEARQWMFSRQKLLDGQAPAELIQTGHIDDVLRLVSQIRDAAHL